MAGRVTAGVTAMLGVLLSLFAAVAFGAVVPIVPTGAAVSGAAAYAVAPAPAAPCMLVIAVGAAAAYLGDLLMYAMCRWGGEQLARRLHWLRDHEQVVALPERLRERQVSVLLVSRLLPGGRIPVLLAAALMGLELAAVRGRERARRACCGPPSTRRSACSAARSSRSRGRACSRRSCWCC